MTPKQRAFVKAYAGNATEAAIQVGYSRKTARSIGQKLLTNIDILNAIREREDEEARLLVASRLERQAFWTTVMRGEQFEMRDRIRAAELLAKSEGDFITRVESKIEGAVMFTWA